MDRKIVLSVLTAALSGFIGIWLLLSLMPDQRAGVRLYPWDVTRDRAGRIRVFDLTLGADTLADARALLGAEGKINLFVRPNGRRAVEVFFDDIYLSNLRADWILTLDLDTERLEAMYQRGLRVSKVGSGSNKVKMAPEDIETLSDEPIRTLTYLPWKRLATRDIEGNFGFPDEQYTESNGVVHWLYPSKGMDLARDPQGAVVIQFLNPDEFDRAVSSLKVDGH